MTSSRSQTPKRQKTREAKLPAPLPHQLPMLQCDSRFMILVCGRRWGKTVLGLLICLVGHGQNKKWKGALQGGHVWWIAPTYGIASLIWRDLKDCLADVWLDKSEVDKRIDLPGGGSITVKSSDNPDTLRGAGLDGVVFDEAAYMSEEVWTLSIRPALADHGGWAVFISTPKMDDEKKGEEWFKRLFLEAMKNPMWSWWQRPTMDNPTIKPDELEALKKMPDLAYRQEIMAEFVNVDEGLFKREWFRQYYTDESNYYLRTDEGLLTVRKSDCEVFCTVDLAATVQDTSDFSVIGTWARTPANKLILLDIQRGKYTEAQTKWLIYNSWQTWNPRYIGIEKAMTGFAYIQEFMDTGTVIRTPEGSLIEVLPGFVKITELTPNKSKFARAETVAQQYKAGMVFHPDPQHIHAPWLENYCYELLSFPKKTVHDDCVDVAAYAGVELGKPTMIVSAKDVPLFIFGGAKRY